METKEYKKGKLSCQLWSGETGLPLLVVLDEPAYKARPEIFISEKFQEKHPCSVLWVQSEKDLTEWEQGLEPAWYNAKTRINTGCFLIYVAFRVASSENAAVNRSAICSLKRFCSSLRTC